MKIKIFIRNLSAILRSDEYELGQKYDKFSSKELSSRLRNKANKLIAFEQINILFVRNVIFLLLVFMSYCSLNI